MLPSGHRVKPTRHNANSGVGLGTQTTAWKVKHKLRQAMLERDAAKHLTAGSRSMTPIRW
jgi:hypothetical protein